MSRKTVYCPPASVLPAYVSVCNALNSHFHLDGDCRAVVDGHLQDNGIQVYVTGLRSLNAKQHSYIQHLLETHGIQTWDWWVDDSGLRLHLFKAQRDSFWDCLMLTIPILVCWYFDVHKIYVERFG